MRPHFAALALWLGMIHAAAAQEWSQFRGPHGNGVAPTPLPTEWGPQQQIVWKVKLAGLGWSQPVVAGDRIFVTTAETDKQGRPRKGDWDPSPGYNPLLRFLGAARPKAPDAVYRWKLLCLDAGSGKEVWEQVARNGKPGFAIHPNNSYATETPATDGERVIAYFGMTGVYCYDLAGKLLWSKELEPSPIQMDWGTGSSPVLLGAHVYVQCDNDKASFLLALDKRTGAEAWRSERDEKSNWSTPYVWKNKLRTELVVAGGGRMRAHDPATGKLLWEMAGAGRAAQTPVGDDEMLYVDSQDRLTGREGPLTAIRAGASGDISLKPGQTSSDWIAWSVRVAGVRVASPLLYRDCVYVLNEMQGLVRCHDAKTGKEHYRQRLPRAAGCTASPWASGEHVYCLDDHGLTAVLRAGPRFEVVATNDLDEMFWASPAIVGNRLLLRGADHLYCIGK
jgi:outer membrane protein assembly factor BamB